VPLAFAACCGVIVVACSIVEDTVAFLKRQGLKAVKRLAKTTSEDLTPIFASEHLSVGKVALVRETLELLSQLQKEANLFQGIGSKGGDRLDGPSTASSKRSFVLCGRVSLLLRVRVHRYGRCVGAGAGRATVQAVGIR
jgi:hypothetical protein